MALSVDQLSLCFFGYSGARLSSRTCPSSNYVQKMKLARKHWGAFWVAHGDFVL